MIITQTNLENFQNGLLKKKAGNKEVQFTFDSTVDKILLNLEMRKCVKKNK